MPVQGGSSLMQLVNMQLGLVLSLPLTSWKYTLEVLESERSLFRAELLASSTRRQQLVAFVTLYKALGGGWTPTER